ncbi:hypothetical protein CFP56_031343 [Quercus suber]|uniref:Transposase n=1 Tax=Quercus suber TaxID=58331 RepID=A0AAW0JLH0_QUESU|nr:hypothetical protein CFP56_69230 [Quercus suber]
MDSNCFSLPEVKHYCAELGVLDYVQFYFLVLGLDLNNGPRYLSTDANTQELFKCLDPIDHKIDIYVEHATHVQQQLLVKDVSVIDGANLVGCGVSVEDVDVDDVDGDGDDNEVDVEGRDEALTDDEFEKGGNLVDEGNDAKGNDENGVVGDVDYEWYNSDYDEPTNEKLYEITLDEVDGNTFQPTIIHNDLFLTLFNWLLDEIPSGSNYASLDELHSLDNSDGEQKKKLPEFKLEYLKDLKFVLGMSFKDNKQFKELACGYKLKH